MAYDESRTDETRSSPDRFYTWRKTGDIGYVYLAFAIIIEAIKDLFYGDINNVIDACSFWHGAERIDDDTLEGRWSSCKLWLAVLGMDDIPDIVSDELNGRRDIKTDERFQRDVEEYLRKLEHLFGLMKVDYYGVIAEQETNAKNYNGKA